MANEKKTFADVLASLSGGVSGTLVLRAVDADVEETKALIVGKGKDEKGALKYVAGADNVVGKVSGSVAAAVNSLLKDGLKVLPSAWVVPNNEKDIRFPSVGDNKPKDPEKLEDLDADTQAAMRDGMDAVKIEFAAYKDAEGNAREKTLTLARTLRNLRTSYRKGLWAIFAAQASGDLAAFLTSKNSLGEFVFMGGLPSELLDLMPEGKNSPKAAQAWVNGLRSALAAAVVEKIKVSAELADTGVSDAVRLVMEAHESGEDVLVFEVDGEAVETLRALHWANMGAAVDGRFFDLNADGELTPKRDAEKAHVTKSLFGTEGCDELVTALCRAFNSYRTNAEKAVEAETRKTAKSLASTIRAFDGLSVDEAALHLFRIMAGRFKTDTEDALSASVEDANAVLDKIGGFVDAIASGAMTLGDVINPPTDAPKTEGDAEADADAEA